METDYSDIKIRLKIPDYSPAINLRQSWNISPTEHLLAVTFDGKSGERRATLMHWGLIAPWAVKPTMAGATFNARAESITEKATYGRPWKVGCRCPIMVDGFYEWRKPDKTPFTFERIDGSVMAIAGLFEKWLPEPGAVGEPVRSCTIVTIDANADLDQIHTRMPMILDTSDWSTWLGETVGGG